MGFASISLTFLIAVVYNIFIHYLTSTMFKDYAYQQKFSNTLTLLFVSGIVGVVLGKIFLPDNPKLSNVAINKGLFYGGVMLIITSLFVNWENMNHELRLIMIGSIFAVLIWLSYKYIDDDEEVDEESQEVQELLESLE
jgi:Ca2+/Na+ antiporter